MTAPSGRVVAGHPFEFAQAEHQRPSRNWHNCCAIFTRLAFDQPAVGDFDGDGTADAEDQWKAAKYKHPETDPTRIPRGVPVYWAGGSSDNGHAAVSRGDGLVWGTDLLRDGQVDVYRIASVQERWGLTLLGWTEDFAGVRVWQPDPVVKPTPVPPAPSPHHPNVDAMRAAGERALKANKPGPVRAAVRKALRALGVIR
jgi:hypothetical protein